MAHTPTHWHARFAGALLVGCGGAAPERPNPEPAPLGMILQEDGITYAGAAVIDLTPTITETFTDLDGNSYFDGCLDDPTCGEPFDDANGDGWFDAVFIGGFGPMRPALDVHDPVTARAVVVSHDGEYLAFVSLDFVGLGSPRIAEARDRLVAEGFDPARLVVASSHNHQGPDTMGLWGNPYDLANPISGTNPEYQARVTDAIERAVRDAASAMEPVSLRVGAQHLRDRDPYFNGAQFGGRNPTDKMHGMIYDGRDPVVISDQVLALQATGDTTHEVVFTLTNWSGHPEVRGSANNSISSDWVGVTREVLEAHYGGVALHLPECLGGMQSALGGDLPLVEPDGTHVYQACTPEAAADPNDAGCFGKGEGDVRTDDDGLPVPEWAPRESWDFVTSHGWHIAEAAIDILESGEAIEAAPLRVATEPLYVPIENLVYQILAPSGVFELGLDNAVFDPVLCPLAATSELGCIQTLTSRVELGPIGWLAVPGELLPELAWGFPDDDPQWLDEQQDPGARGPGARYFPQHDPDCDGLDYADCVETSTLGDCDCLQVHAWPYRLSDDPSVPPLLDLLETPYRAVIGMSDDYLSYIIPEPDFNRHVSLLIDDGDHYEDTVSPSHVFASELQAAQQRIAERW